MENRQIDWSKTSRIYRVVKLTKKYFMNLEEGHFIESDLQYFDKTGKAIPKFGEYVAPTAEREEQWIRITSSLNIYHSVRIYQKRSDS